MGYTEMPFYYQGAIIYDSDFDAEKLLRMSLKNSGEEKEVIEKILNYDENQVMSEEIGSILRELCFSDDLQTITDVKKNLLDTLPCEIVSHACMDNDDFHVRSFDGEDSIIFSADSTSNGDSDWCYFIILENPMAWIGDVPANKRISKKIIKSIKKGTKEFLKDDINWWERLGVLTGIYQV